MGKRRGQVSIVRRQREPEAAQEPVRDPNYESQRSAPPPPQRYVAPTPPTVEKDRLTIYLTADLVDRLERAQSKLKRLPGVKARDVSTSAMVEHALSSILDDYELNEMRSQIVHLLL